MGTSGAAGVADKRTRTSYMVSGRAGAQGWERERRPKSKRAGGRTGWWERRRRPRRKKTASPPAPAHAHQPTPTDRLPALAARPRIAAPRRAPPPTPPQDRQKAKVSETLAGACSRLALPKPVSRGAPPRAAPRPRLDAFARLSPRTSRCALKTREHASPPTHFSVSSSSTTATALFLARSPLSPPLPSPPLPSRRRCSSARGSTSRPSATRARTS